MSDQSQREGTRFYGRRRGKKLRGGRQALMDDLLPRLRVPLDAGTLDVPALFDRPFDEYWLEIGFGGGEHLSAQAAARADVGFIGCEPFVNGVAKLLSQIDEGGQTNIRVHDEDVRLLFDKLPDRSFGRIFLQYPDPWPKKRHWFRRFVNPENLDQLARLLPPGGIFRYASDHMGYVRWTLQKVRAHGAFRWTARTARDWRERPADGFPTRYETKALKKGDRCVYLEFERI